MTFTLIANIRSVKVREYNKESVRPRWKAGATQKKKKTQEKAQGYLFPLDASGASVS